MSGEAFERLAPLFLDSWLNIKNNFMKISFTPNFTVFTRFLDGFSTRLEEALTIVKK